MVLHVEHLRKEYRGGTLANDDINLRVTAGEVHGLFGHNGAGKTTLINQVIGLVKPTAGTITLGGRDVIADPDFARKTCAIQPQAQMPFRGVTPTQAVEIVARLRGAKRAQARTRTRELFDALDITEWANTPGERLSGGVRRLATFCMAAAGPSRLVMLDEPSNDVDPVRRRLLWRQVRVLADSGTAVLVVTHNVIEAATVVDQVTILDRGTVVAAGPPDVVRGDATSMEDAYIRLVGGTEACNATLVA